MRLKNWTELIDVNLWKLQALQTIETGLIKPFDKNKGESEELTSPIFMAHYIFKMALFSGGRSHAVTKAVGEANVVELKK